MSSVFKIVTPPPWAFSTAHYDEPLFKICYIMRANRTYYGGRARVFEGARDKDGVILDVAAQPSIRRDVEDAVESRLKTIGRRTGTV